jgi:hypothetical protein
MTTTKRQRRTKTTVMTHDDDDHDKRLARRAPTATVPGVHRGRRLSIVNGDWRSARTVGCRAGAQDARHIAKRKRLRQGPEAGEAPNASFDRRYEGLRLSKLQAGKPCGPAVTGQWYLWADIVELLWDAVLCCGPTRRALGPPSHARVLFPAGRRDAAIGGPPSRATVISLCGPPAVRRCHWTVGRRAVLCLSYLDRQARTRDVDAETCGLLSPDCCFAVWAANIFGLPRWLLRSLGCPGRHTPTWTATKLCAQRALLNRRCDTESGEATSPA